MAADNLLAIIVRFTIVPEMMDCFVDLVRENARLSVSVEPGCERFDVLVPRDRKAEIVLYELYNSTEQFNDHLSRPHYLTFDAATRSMVVEKRVERFELANAPKP
jgi:(4S)-4-hydroxy-5-phosphonooxypentane-2,3-dione isomerase